MIPRYTRPEMAALWTDEARWKIILEIEFWPRRPMQNAGRQTGGAGVAPESPGGCGAHSRNRV
jgi:hypothetical protein